MTTPSARCGGKRLVDGCDLCGTPTEHDCTRPCPGCADCHPLDCIECKRKAFSVDRAMSYDEMREGHAYHGPDCVTCGGKGWVPVRGVYPSTIDCDTRPDPCPTYRRPE